MPFVQVIFPFIVVRTHKLNETTAWTISHTYICDRQSNLLTHTQSKPQRVFATTHSKSLRLLHTHISMKSLRHAKSKIAYSHVNRIKIYTHMDFDICSVLSFRIFEIYFRSKIFFYVLTILCSKSVTNNSRLTVVWCCTKYYSHRDKVDHQQLFKIDN